MFVVQTGSGSGGTVLLLHALGLDHTMWRSPAAALDDCRVLAPDLPGFGRSRLEQGGLDAAVDECAALLRSVAQVAVVAGVSYGGYVAALLAAAHPEVVAGVALSGVRRRVPPAGVRLQATLFRAVRARSLSRGESVPASALAAEKRNLIDATEELGRVDLRPVLPRITVPTVIFAPARDWFVRREVSNVAAAIPGARVVPIAGAGHLWPKSRPEPLTNAVRDLLAAAHAA
jgi:pimeloyl-ACP methyl ester carboxylesterase